MLILLHVHRETHEPNCGSCVSLYCDACYVSYLNFMPQCCSVSPFETRSSYGTHLLDHLAAHGTGLAAGQVAVVALLQIDAHLLWCVFTTKIVIFLRSIHTKVCYF